MTVTHPVGGARVRLDRTRVLQAAVAFADAHGLDALSMRALAASLGVVPMALYKHVADKDDLRAGMIDAVVADLEPPPPGLPWQASVRERVLVARRAVGEHPWLRQAIEAATVRTPVVLGHMDAVAGDFIDGGVSADLTHYAMHALGHRIWGFSPEAFSAPAAGSTAGSTAGPPPTAQDGAPGPGTAPSAQLMHELAQRFPHVAAITNDSFARTGGRGCDEDAEFAFTLDLLLAAIAGLHESGWTSTGTSGGARS